MIALLAVDTALPGHSLGTNRAAPEARIRFAMDTEQPGGDAAFELGEPIIIRLEVWVSSWFQAPVDFPATLSTAFAIVEAIGGSPEAAFDDIDGRRWTGLIRRYRVHPLHSGAHVLDLPAALEIVPGRGDGLPVRVLPPGPLKLHVRVPKGAEGLNPFIAARRLELHQQWEPSPDPDRGWQVGDMILRRVTLITDATSPLPPAVLGFEKTDDTEAPIPSASAHPANTDRARSNQVHTARYALKTPGELQLPDVELAWWDIEERSVRVSRLPGRMLRIAPASASADPFAEPGQEPASDSVKTSHRASGAPVWSAIPAAAVALALGTLAWRRRSALAAQVRHHLPRVHASEPRARRRLRRACLQDRPEQAAVALRAWLHAVPAPSRRRIHADSACAEAIHALERHLHGPQTSWSPASWIGRPLWYALQHARAVDPERGDAHATLPALNPNEPRNEASLHLEPRA